MIEISAKKIKKGLFDLKKYEIKIDSSIYESIESFIKSVQKYI